MKLIGRDKELSIIDDCIAVHEMELGPEGSPIGKFFIAGPTGCGKTRTAEYVAWRLHGNPRAIVRIDCGEFQLEHEVARLIGAPPGYIGHKETSPLLTQQRLNNATSGRSRISVVVFDEIEKAAGSLNRLLLGIMDKAVLRLGDNTVINFENSILFFTSNLGTRDLFEVNRYEIGQNTKRRNTDSGVREAIKKHFAPEFINRLDSIFVYSALTEDECLEVVRAELDAFCAVTMERHRGSTVIWDASLCDAILERGFSQEYGGRNLKRAIYREVIVPLAKWGKTNRLNYLTGENLVLSWENGLVIDRARKAGARSKA